MAYKIVVHDAKRLDDGIQIEVGFTRYSVKDSAGRDFRIYGFIHNAFNYKGERIEFIDWKFLHIDIAGTIHAHKVDAMDKEIQQVHRVVIRYLRKHKLINE